MSSQELIEEIPLDAVRASACLVVTMTRFAGELVDVDRFRFPAAKLLRDNELAMARQLIDSLSAAWQPGQYYRANLMRIIHAKVEGKTPEQVSERRAARRFSRGLRG